MNEKIICYGSPVCGMVPGVRNMLDRAEVVYEYVDIFRDDEARQRVSQINQGYESVPTLVFPDGSTLTEPSLAELKQKLETLGHSVPKATPIQQARVIATHPTARIFGVFSILGGMLNDSPPWLFAGVFVLAAGLVLDRIMG